jgi:hypothetical protein
MSALRRLAAAGAVALALLLGGCGYRVAAPAPLGEAVRIEIAVDEARLVRAQAYLQTAVAQAIEGKLGWRVSPTGSARLSLTLKRETVQTNGTADRDIPAQWTITLEGDALLTAQRGKLFTGYTGTGYASALASEPDALRAAAQTAAESIAAWLDGEARKWK